MRLFPAFPSVAFAPRCRIFLIITLKTVDGLSALAQDLGLQLFVHGSGSDAVFALEVVPNNAEERKDTAFFRVLSGTAIPLSQRLTQPPTMPKPS